MKQTKEVYSRGRERKGPESERKEEEQPTELGSQQYIAQLTREGERKEKGREERSKYQHRTVQAH